MAIAFDAVTDGGAVGAAPKTWSHTCAAGASLVVLVYTNNSTDDVNTVTYNGVAMTRIVGVSSAAIYSMSAWYLQSPASGANTVSVSSASSLSGRSLSYTGVAGGVDSFNSGLDTTPATITASLTTVAANCWQVSMCANDGSVPTASTGWTARAGTTGAVLAGDSNGALSAGANSMNCTTSSGANATWVTVGLSPTAAAAGVSLGTSRLLMGVGV